MCALYCTGEFVGFDADDVLMSPRLADWMRKEIGYGEKQREYARRWFAFMAHADLTLDAKQLAAPVDASTPRRAELIAAVRQSLWRKVKEDTMQQLPRNPGEPPSSPPDRVDFRFCNIAHVPDERLLSHPAGDDFEQLLWQAVARCDFAASDADLTPLLPVVRNERNPRLLARVLQGAPRLSSADEPRDLLFLG
jgi:hypothetical protein